MNGAQIVVGQLKKAGVTTIFSLSGNQIMPIYDACIDAEIRIIHVRHEAAAVFMADAWTQVTGQIGVALLTAAPGYLNGIGPVYSALKAESPVLLISGDSPVSLDGNGAFQEMDQLGVSRSLFKHVSRPTSVNDLEGELANAMRQARSGRCGPVHIAMPFDVLNAQTTAKDDQLGHEPEERKLPDDELAAIMRELEGAERPLILTGPSLSASRQPHLVHALQQATGIPVVAMESPRGLNDPSLGAFQEILAKADAILLLGKPIDFTLKFAADPHISKSARVMVVDPEQPLIDRARKLLADRLIVASCADALVCAHQLHSAARSPHQSTQWSEEAASAIHFRGADHSPESTIHPRDICAAAQKVLDGADDPILVCDGGEVGQWAQAFCSASTRIINGPSGAIGGSLSYAIAAKIARPDATVVALMGDGTAGFHFAEFDTAVRESTDITVAICNDFAWNAEVQIQKRDYGPDRLIGCTLAPSARYDQAAAGLGCHGEHVTTPDQLDQAFNNAVNSGKPACLNIEMKGESAPSFRRS